MSCRIVDVHYCRICQCTLPLPMRAAIHASSAFHPVMDCPSFRPIISRCCWFFQHCRSHQCSRIRHCLIVSFRHCFVKPWTIHRLSPQLALAHCCASYCVLLRMHAADFRYWSTVISHIGGWELGEGLIWACSPWLAKHVLKPRVVTKNKFMRPVGQNEQHLASEVRCYIYLLPQNWNLCAKWCACEKIKAVDEMVQTPGHHQKSTEKQTRLWKETKKKKKHRKLH